MAPTPQPARLFTPPTGPAATIRGLRPFRQKRTPCARRWALQAAARALVLRATRLRARLHDPELVVRGIEEARRGGLDVRAGRPRDFGVRVGDRREALAAPVRLVDRLDPPLVVLEVRLVLAADLLADLCEVGIADAFLRAPRELGEHCLLQLVDVLRIAAEHDLELAPRGRLLRQRRVAGAAVAAAHVLAQHLAQADLEDLREHLGVALAVERPAIGGDGRQRDEALRLGARDDRLFDRSLRPGDADVLPVRVLAGRGQAREVGLDERLQQYRVDVADEHEREAAEVGAPRAAHGER